MDSLRTSRPRRRETVGTILLVLAGLVAVLGACGARGSAKQTLIGAVPDNLWITSSDWNGWSRDHKPTARTVSISSEVGRSAQVPTAGGMLTVTIESQEPGKLLVRTDQPMSPGRNGININTTETRFEVRMRGTTTISTPSEDAGTTVDLRLLPHTERPDGATGGPTGGPTGRPTDGTAAAPREIAVTAQDVNAMPTSSTRPRPSVPEKPRVVRMPAVVGRQATIKVLNDDLTLTVDSIDPSGTVRLRTSRGMRGAGLDEGAPGTFTVAPGAPAQLSTPTVDAATDVTVVAGPDRQRVQLLRGTSTAATPAAVQHTAVVAVPGERIGHSVPNGPRVAIDVTRVDARGATVRTSVPMRSGSAAAATTFTVPAAGGITLSGPGRLSVRLSLEDL